MKITKRQLKRIIKEELQLLNEGLRGGTEQVVRDYFENKDDPRDAAIAVYEDYDDIQKLRQISKEARLLDPKFAGYVWEVANEADEIAADGSNMFDEPDRHGGSRNRRY